MHYNNITYTVHFHLKRAEKEKQICFQTSQTEHTDTVKPSRNRKYKLELSPPSELFGGFRTVMPQTGIKIFSLKYHSSFSGTDLWTKAPNCSQLESRAHPSVPLLIQALLKSGLKLHTSFNHSSLLFLSMWLWKVELPWAEAGHSAGITHGRPAAMAPWPDGK